MASPTPVTPEDVEKHTKPTAGFLCPLSANTYGIEFLQFTISDYESKKIIFEVGRNTPPQDMSIDLTSTNPEDMYRRIKYEFSEDVLRLPFVETSLVFSVGKSELKSFKMIERHYFRDQLVKSFSFQFGFCIPGSTNTWDAVYNLPSLSEELITDMINNPHETKSDSFYFVDNKLAMHNKASYKYIREDAAQAKKSYEEKFGSKGSKEVSAKYVSPAYPAEEKTISKSKADSKLLPEFDDCTLISTTSTAEAKEISRVSRTNQAKLQEKEVMWSKETDYA